MTLVGEGWSWKVEAVHAGLASPRLQLPFLPAELPPRMSTRGKLGKRTRDWSRDHASLARGSGHCSRLQCVLLEVPRCPSCCSPCLVCVEVRGLVAWGGCCCCCCCFPRLRLDGERNGEEQEQHNGTTTADGWGEEKTTATTSSEQQCQRRVCHCVRCARHGAAAATMLLP